MEKCCDLFDRLPIAECRRLFGDNADAVLELRKLKSRLKAKVTQTERKMQCMDREQAQAEAEVEAMLEIEEQQNAAEAASSKPIAIQTAYRNGNAFTSQTSSSSSSNIRPSQTDWSTSSHEKLATATPTEYSEWNNLSGISLIYNI